MRNFYTSRLRTKTWLTFLVAWGALSLLSLAWAMATPMAGSPDEPSHIIKAAAVVRGQLVGNPTSDPAVTQVTIPRDLASARAWPCFATNAAEPASCNPPIPGGWEPTSAKTSAGLYNPLYYALVGWPSLLTDNARIAVYGMRAVSALISSFLLATAFSALLLFRRPVIAGVGFFAAATPMVFFLNGSVNPNSIEISAGVALMAVLMLVVRGPVIQHQKTALSLIAISGVLLANARGISPLWMALIAVVALIAAPRGRILALLRQRAVIVVLAVLILGVVGAVGWLLKTGTLTSMGTFQGAGQTTPPAAFVVMVLDHTFDPGLIGYFGWLDTPAPGVAFAVWSFLGFSVLGLALIATRGRSFWSVVAAIGGWVFLPAIVQAASVEKSGYIWQGRYSLLAYAVAIIAGSVAVASRETTTPAVAPVSIAWKRRSLILIAAAFAGGQLFTLLNTIRRYAIGAGGDWITFLAAPSWSPPGGELIWPFFGLVGLALLVTLWWAHSDFWERDPQVSNGAKVGTEGLA